MRRLVAFVVLFAVVYASMGVAIYLNDFAREWCEVDDLTRLESGLYVLIWPLRLIAGDGICG